MTNQKHDPLAEGLDVFRNRRADKWSTGELIARALWELVQPTIFGLSPRPFWAWRRMVLRWFGAEIGKQVHIYPSVRIAIPWKLTVGDDSAIGEGAIIYSLGRIEIGKRVTISQFAHLCAGTHDYRLSNFPLKKLPILIKDDAWICASAFVGPGVKIGERAIVSACGVAMKDVGSDTISGGNPARFLKARPPLK